jgi:murein DD-endopeptidase MepM/ murein hydrolase activator NlpD
MRYSFLAFLVLLSIARAEGPLPVSAHNCYRPGPSNDRLVDALALGIDNIEIDLGWDEKAGKLIVGHDAVPRPGATYVDLDTYLVPALEAHWKSSRAGAGPTVLTIDWKTEKPEAVRRFTAFLDAHPDWFSSAPKADSSPLSARRLTVCFTGSDRAKAAYDALIPSGGIYRAFRDQVFGQGAPFEDDVSRYVPTLASSYHRFLTFHWSAVEKGGPAVSRDWNGADAERLAALVSLAHARGFRTRFYCLNGHTGTLLSGYQFPNDEAARIRWRAAVTAGVDWVATDEYAAIADFLKTDASPHAPEVRVVDLDAGETAKVVLADGSTADVRVDGTAVEHDSIRGAVRNDVVRVTINGEHVLINSCQYELPRTIGGLQVDCPVTAAYLQNSTVDHWRLKKAVRLRFWPADRPWIEPETLAYPAHQRWFVNLTQMANEPVYVDGGEAPKNKSIYYHSGLDIGGVEGMTEVIAATDGLVVSSGLDRLPGLADSPIDPRYDVVYLRDDRDWYYRYSHMKTIDSSIKPGATVKKGQRIGVLGKEGGSGGWSHLHFEIKARMPSGKWGTQEGYAFLWQAALREQSPEIIAVARPHVFTRAGQTVTLSGARSWARSGKIAHYVWTFSDGSTTSGESVQRAYRQPGSYSEILQVTDEAGQVDYDFAVVHVVDPDSPAALPPTLHASYYPTTSLGPGDEITFKARTFRVGKDGKQETWDFGDGSPPIHTESDGNAQQLAPDGYAMTTHRYAKPGDYLVRVERANRDGLKATARLHVRVSGPVDPSKRLK